MSEDRETVMYMGTSLRELVHKWRFKTLMLVKLLLLQRRVMFFGYPVEQLCNYQYSLVSLIPGLLLNLQDAGDPQLHRQGGRVKAADSLRSSDRKSLLKFLGMPLDIFGEDAFFQPYCPLQQIDLLKSRTWLVGTAIASSSSSAIARSMSLLILSMRISSLWILSCIRSST